MQDNTYWVYVLASRFRGTLYVGVTNSLERRIAEHKAKAVEGFTARYGVRRLVFHRGFGEITEAIHFEKQLKRWRRDWKIRLIEEDNPHWADLYPEMMALPPLHPDLAAALADNIEACHPGLGAAQDRDDIGG
ncbi:MAG: GIY-YIG nuclease family protein [Phenylobacterium sp.]|nr:GIY-YIG nuclease family protein [Phenylobacterium sp.]